MARIQADSIYYLTNANGGTCMDLSGHDNYSIIGYGYHQSLNQLWIFQRAEDDQSYYIRSVRNSQYLSISGDLRNGRKLSSGTPFRWRVETEHGVDNGVRLSPAGNSNFCIDLDCGNSAPGTAIQLWSRSAGHNQVWKAKRLQ